VHKALPVHKVQLAKTERTARTAPKVQLAPTDQTVHKVQLAKTARTEPTEPTEPMAQLVPKVTLEPKASKV
jgi:hypothetical protein